MDATAFHSMIMVFRKATAFPLRRAIVRRWNKKVVLSVSLMSFVTVVMRLCQLYRHLMPHTSCFHGTGIEDVCVVQFFRCIAYLSVFFCAAVQAAAPGVVAVLAMLSVFFYRRHLKQKRRKVIRRRR